MRRNRRSSTSDWVAALRALYTPGPAGTESVGDREALALLPRGLAATVRAAQLHPLATRLVHRGLGRATLGLTWGVPLRTLEIDEFVRNTVAADTEQLVIVGAGLDARAYRMPELAKVHVFELDHPSTQAYKRERAGAAVCRELTYAAIDFERQSLEEVLGACAFDPGKPTMWIWEGVTMYLEPSAVDMTLGAISDLSARGSRLAVTYLPRDYADGWVRAVGLVAMRTIGEELRARYDAKDMEALLSAHGFSVLADDTTEQWALRWPKRERGAIRNWERLARAERR